MNDALFNIAIAVIFGISAIMMIIGFIFSPVHNKRTKKPLGNASACKPFIPKPAYPLNYKKYVIRVVIEGKKGTITRYGTDFISVNRELIKEYRDRGIKIETLTFKELDK